MDEAKRVFQGKHAELTGQIIQAFYRVYNQLGHGFLEKVYRNALALELERSGMSITREKHIRVYYEGEVVGEYAADLLVNDLVIVEIKAAETLVESNEAQLLNYLKATTIEVGLLLNFGPTAQLKRKIFDNEHKGSLHWTTPK